MARPKARRPAPPAGGMREAILDAAEARMRESGPGAIRLQEVAAEVGISHPAVLHHFGSREGLVHAVVERAIRTLQDDLAQALSREPPSGEDGGAMLFERVFEVLFDKGHARLMAWLVLGGHDSLATDQARAGWEAIAQLTHASRVAAAGKRTPPSYEDTRFTIVLSALALFGQAIAGRTTFDMAGFGRGPAVDRKFRAWLAATLAEHLRGGPGLRRLYRPTARRRRAATSLVSTGKSRFSASSTYVSFAISRRGRFFSIARTMSSAARSAGIVFRSKNRTSFARGTSSVMRALLMMFVLMPPGCTHVMPTPVPCSSAPSDSVNPRTANLLAQ